MQSPLDMILHPLELREHGTTPGGLSLYRIVWADSRISKLGYEGKLHTFPRYEDQLLTHGKWILEKWLPAEKYVGMTRDAFETFLAAQPGAPTEEYPTDGEYELVHIFAGLVDSAKVRQLIDHMEFRLRNVSLKDRKQEVVQEAADLKVAVKVAKLKVLEDALGRDTPTEKVGVIYG
jgi:hypothetical protein